MAKKALIVYASVTGNTEKVAKKFKEVFEKKGTPWGEWECDIYKITKKSDKKNAPYHLEDYDFICVGAPIWAGIPPLYLFDDHLGALGSVLMPKAMLEMSLGEPPSQRPDEELMGSMMDQLKAGWSPKKGVVFVTYGGQGQGPIEATAALSCLELRLDAARVKTVGKFACCGKQWDEPPVDRIANRFGWMVGDTTVAIARYKENPNDPEFANLSAEERKLFDRAVKETQKFKPGMHHGMRSWHYEFHNRPTERDLLKAEIFLSEILEDYYWGGVEMYPYSQYVCIA
jgi:hypothetical protein